MLYFYINLNLQSRFIWLLILLSVAGGYVFGQPATFNYTGAVQIYTVPAGCTSIIVDIVGAQGGNYSAGANHSFGGKGGRAQGTIAVAPGQVLQIYVGHQGDSVGMEAITFNAIGNGLGGSNSGGGAQGGNGGTFTPDATTGGGGSSDIRTIAGDTFDALNSRLIAGAGGGGGGNNSCPGMNGGGGGGLTGEGGLTWCPDILEFEHSGYPGTQTSGGAGGAVFALNGGFGFGGAGQLDAGGGGGWYGAGGADGGGACGGSSYIGGAGVTSATTTASFREGDGYVIIAPSIPGVITGEARVCAGATTALSDTSSGGTWSSSNTSIATVGSTGEVTGVAAGTATITYALPSSSFTTVVVTVETTPDAGTITGTASVCLGGTTTLSDTAIGGTWDSDITSVATIGSGSGIVTGVAAGTALITYTVSNSCNTTKTTLMVTVDPSPDAGTITGIATVCVGATTTLSDATSGGTWSSDNSSIATVGTSSGAVTGVMNGTATISYTVSTTCGTASVTLVVTVMPLPDAGTITGTAILCAGTTTTLSDAVTGGTWSSSNTTVATINSSGTVTSTAVGTTSISYSFTNSCGTAIATQIVTVVGTPSAGTITGGTSVHQLATLALSDGISGGTWSVSNSNATISADGVVTGVNVGTVIVSYTVTNACGTAVTTKVINVLFTLTTPITGTLGICTGATTALSNATPGGVWSSASSVAILTIIPSTGVVTGVAAGTGLVTYTVMGSTQTAVITVNPFPANISGSVNVCLGATTMLIDTTTGGSWSSSNPGIASVGATTGTVTGMATGSATISYTLSFGCYKTWPITVKPLPAAITGPSGICIGTPTTYTDATTGGLSWASSNTSVATIGTISGVATGVSVGTATITYTLSTGCSTTKDISVNVLPAPITGPATVCVGSTIALSSATTGGSWTSSVPLAGTVGSATGIVTGIAFGLTNVYYSLSGCSRMIAMTVNALPATITGVTALCAGSTTALHSITAGGTWSSSSMALATVGTTGVVTAVGAGSVAISYTLANGCSQIANVTVSADPAISGYTSICTANATTLTDSIPGGTWTSSNTTVAVIGASTGILTGGAVGTTNITYTLSAYCRSIAMVTVGAPPVAISGSTVVCTGLTTTLTDATSGGTWSSSHPGVASIGSSTGIVTGITYGTSTIIYATGPVCYRYVVMTVGTGLGAITGLTSMCVGFTNIYISTAPAIGVGWSSSNASVATVGTISGVVTAVSPGTAIITFTPYPFSTYAGCVATKTVTVDAVPTVAAITGPTSVPVGHTMTLADATPGGTWSSSNTAKLTVSAGGVVTGVAVPAATISYNVTNGACVYPVTRLITVTAPKEAPPAINTDADLSIYPNPTTGTFTLQSSLAGVFTIYTLEGKEIQRSTVMEGANIFSMPKGLAAGIYMCRFNGEDGSTAMVRLVYEP